MLYRRLLYPILVLAGTCAWADSANLAFQTAGEGQFQFDTGVLTGRLKVDGKHQGLYPLVDAVTGDDLTPPPGLFSPYRVFTAGRRYGDAARDWPTQSRLLGQGGVEVRWPPAEEHPLEMTAVYRWTAPDTLDLEIAVKPQQEMRSFELFMSSYFAASFRASVYVQGTGGQPATFLPADRTPNSPGGYVMFPSDDQAVHRIQDGRWAIPPSPVDWAIHRPLAAPVAMRRDEGQDLTALMMCPPNDCFAVGSPWNAESRDAGGYRSLYLSLFGRDLAAKETARARCRLVVRRHVTNDDAVRCYQEYLGQPADKP